jgi:hypothetical protein
MIPMKEVPKQPEMKHLKLKVFHETLPRYAVYPFSRYTAHLQKIEYVHFYT